ncbi:MAG: PhoX family phosphatase [Neptuniibacter sp.]
MEHDNEISNKSGNKPFENVLEKAVSRRDVVMKGGLAAAVGFMTPAVFAGNKFSGNYLNPKGNSAGSELMGFQPVPVAQGSGPMPAISSDYEYQTLIPWGTPIESGITPYNGDPLTRPSAADQAKMIGIGHDGMWFLPARTKGKLSNDLGVLCINHEFGRNSHVLGKDAPESLEDVQLSQHAHGVSVVALQEENGTWALKYSGLNRRIHVNTPVEFGGPVVASHSGREMLDLNDRPEAQGTVNNCSSGYTPWGTYLTCEENFNGYFGSTGGWTANAAQERYGFSESGFRYGWENFDSRFDLASDEYKNEYNRFGWVVEIDPANPNSKPVKRTALGRFKHEGATVTVGEDNRAVVYMGDDQRFDYIYKFVSAENWKSMQARGVSPLDEGTLYVAKFNDDGSGEWLELSPNNDLLSSWSEEEILVNARMAADVVGATPMDRPEWTTVAPDGYVYCTLTNNSRREVADAANPMAPNADGHIIRWKEADNFVGTSFDWNIFLIAADTHGTEESYSDPDGIWADPNGRLFIQTDGGQKDGLNNQMLVADTETGELRRLFTGVTSDEITGLTVTPDQRTMFINTQHPGNGDPTRTNFPASPDGTTIPRDCTIVIRRKDGGVVGS